jgi:hypothetical protein
MSAEEKVEVRLEPYQERVVDEKRQLDEKIELLTTFLNSKAALDVLEDEQQRLVRQLGIMHLYSRVLGERIKGFLKA